jgi:hypothetical protein
VKPTACLAAALLLAAPAARAQSVDPQAPEPQTAKPQDTRPAAPPEAVLTRAQIDHIFHIRQMEQTLTNAVKAGATTVATQLQIQQPASLFATTDARTRGFDLEGYGVFFDIDVPAMMQSVLYARQVLVDELDTWRERARTTQNEDARRLALSQVRHLEATLGLPPQPVFAETHQPPQGIAVAATTDTVTSPVTPAAATVVPSAKALSASPSSPPVSVPPLPRDPRTADEIYTDAIKNKVIDTILTFGGGLDIDDAQWLIVAARTTTAAPGQIDDSVSVFIRIKGADLNAFVQKKITREEVLTRIQIKEG